ncbi:ERI1 exoribonuclease 2-like [Penaeus chinensis]|uniref:ERI1 exoribonuclease 2-like n=1 Tax=Penaeus chinensis TaxID=139456 RepID=UPI001FB7AF71|nr:ERI1 exoribonuclease 2-like [Penaeus chinensis]
MATKRLALELGLVQKRQTKTSVINKIPKANQEFDYIVVLDFESTCWENGPRLGGQEIIEFPAVLLDVCDGKIVSEFQQYVMPMEQPVLSAFCTNLTGITQEQVDNGIPLGACLYMFSTWIRKMGEEYKVTFNANVSGKRATFATWSDWDLGVCLQYECQRKNLRKPEFFNQWIDIRAVYKNFYQRRPQGLAGALKDLGIAFEGREHSGICDTRNTAALVSRMVRDGCVLTITKTLGTKTKEFSMKAAAQKIFNQVTAVGKRKSDGNQENTGLKRKQKTQDLLTVPEETANGKKIQNSSVMYQDHSSSVLADGGVQSYKEKYTSAISFDLGFQDIVSDTGNEFEKKEQCGNRSFVSKDKNDKNNSNEDSSSSNGVFKVPNLALCKIKSLISNTSKTSAINNSKTPKQSSGTPKLLNYTSIETPVSCNNNRREGLSDMSTNCIQNSELNRSEFNVSLFDVQGFKKTPPLCDCGRRAKLLLVSKPGPNQGRHFFSCPSGKSNLKRCCTFFKWENDPYIKSSPKGNSFRTPMANLNNHLLSKTLPLNRSMHKQKTLGIRRVYSEVTHNKRYYAQKAKFGEGTSADSVCHNENSADVSVQITPYIVKTKQMCSSNIK